MPHPFLYMPAIGLEEVIGKSIAEVDIEISPTQVGSTGGHKGGEQFGASAHHDVGVEPEGCWHGLGSGHALKHRDINAGILFHQRLNQGLSANSTGTLVGAGSTGSELDMGRAKGAELITLGRPFRLQEGQIRNDKVIFELSV
jgi:hypothetical protein